MNPSTGSTSSLIKTPIEFRSEPFRLRLYGAVETCDRPLFAFDIAVKLRDAAALLLDSVRQLVVIAHRLLVLRHVEMLAVAVHEPSLDAVCGCGLFQFTHHQVLQIGKALEVQRLKRLCHGHLFFKPARVAIAIWNPGHVTVPRSVRLVEVQHDLEPVDSSIGLFFDAGNGFLENLLRRLVIEFFAKRVTVSKLEDVLVARLRDVRAALLVAIDLCGICASSPFDFRVVVGDASLAVAFCSLLGVVVAQRFSENAVVGFPDRLIPNREIEAAQFRVNVRELRPICQVRVVPRVVGTG